ncbi:hypothetical protein Unana1_01742 [Umbelopsis nana]
MSLSAEELLKLVQSAQANSENNVEHRALPQTQEHPSSSSWPALPSIDISLLDPNVLNQVRSEYLAQQQTSNASVMPVNTQNETAQADDDSIIESAKSITPEVLMRLSRLAKETDLLPTLRRMQQEQNDRERELWKRREEFMKRLNVEREHLLAREMIGIDVTKELEELEKKTAAEAKMFHQSILRDMDRQKKRQEEQLKQLKVPFFHATEDPSIVKLRPKVFKILLDMLDD